MAFLGHLQRAAFRGTPNESESDDRPTIHVAKFLQAAPRKVVESFAMIPAFPLVLLPRAVSFYSWGVRSWPSAAPSFVITNCALEAISRTSSSSM